MTTVKITTEMTEVATGAKIRKVWTVKSQRPAQLSIAAFRNDFKTSYRKGAFIASIVNIDIIETA